MKAPVKNPVPIPESSRDARVTNIKRLIARFRECDMLRDEITLFLGMSPSAGRKYKLGLIEAKVIAIVDYVPEPAPLQPHPVFGLTPDEGLIEDYIRKVERNLRKIRSPRPPTANQLKAVEREQNRQVHILGDDEPFKVKISDRIPKPDPVLAHLFGRLRYQLVEIEG